MLLGFASAILPDLTLEQVVQFASQEGFACVELMCWPKGKAERRYAGVTHVDVAGFNEEDANVVRDLVRSAGIEISALGYYPNALHDDLEHRKRVVDHLKKVIQGAEKLGVGVVGTFTGRPAALSGRSWQETIDGHFEEYLKVWPDLIKFAGDHNVKIGKRC